MITEIGKFLRKIRIEENEILKDMATKLGVSVSFLSAVETGKKRMPDDWTIKIAQLYRLSEKQRDEFDNAIANSNHDFTFDFSNYSEDKISLAISFARKLEDFDDSQIIAIKEILKGEKK